MEIFGLKTAIIKSGDKLLKKIEKSLMEASLYPQEGDVLAISSKVVALSERRIIDLDKVKGRPSHSKKNLSLDQSEKEQMAALIEGEADAVLPGEYYLTVKNGIFVANAGIDESNAPQGSVIPWPKFPYDSAEKLCGELKAFYSLKNLGVIIVDSVCIPLRAGTIGVAIGYAGFKGVIDKRGEADLFGNELKVTQMNVADSLATSANLVMGEADEAIPFVLMRKTGAEFSDEPVSRREISIDADKCLFKGMYPEDLK